jgi:hypothetical protein
MSGVRRDCTPQTRSKWSKSTLNLLKKSNNQNGWRGIKQSKSHKYHYPIPLVFRIKTIKIPGKSREMENTERVAYTDYLPFTAKKAVPFQAYFQARATGRHICSRCSLCWRASLELGPAAARAVEVMAVAGSVGSVAVASPAVEAARQNGIGAHS